VKVGDLPQDDSILEGHRRACYAQDAAGRYVIAPSRGWEVEAIVNAQAQADVEARTAAALGAVHSGAASPLLYHLTRRHMDVRMLAACSSIWSLRVRWHLRPAVFSRLPDRLLQRYADALGIELATLKTVPERPSRAC
jgi:hypothetical protein